VGAIDEAGVENGSLCELLSLGGHDLGHRAPVPLVMHTHRVPAIQVDARDNRRFAGLSLPLGLRDDAGDEGNIEGDHRILARKRPEPGVAARAG
jgi:hypothetical protein